VSGQKKSLGRDRTLVLFDGLRVPPADKRGQVNIDTLPNALVRSVDVVTGGASAAYGADALGGVTNFMLNRQFKGIKLNSTMGMNEFNNDGKNWKISLAAGTELGDRVNIIGSFETRHIDEIQRLATELDPSWFRRWGHVQNPAWSASDPPGTNPQRITVPWTASRTAHVNGLIVAGGPFGVPPSSALAGRRFTDDGSALVPFNNGDLFDAATISGGPDAQTAHETLPGGPTGYEVDQTNAFFSVVFNLNESISLFGDVLIGKVETKNQSMFEGAALNGPWSPTVYRSNAYLAPSVAAIMDAENRASFRLNKNGSYPGVLDIDNNGQSVNEFDTEMLRAGFDWDIDGNWQMRFSLQSGETTKLTAEYDSIRVDRVNLAIDAVEVYSDMRDLNSDGITDLVAEADRGTGTIICNVQRYNPTEAQLAAHPSVQGLSSSRDQNLPLAAPIGLDNSISDCVPLNIMGHGISPEAAAYIMTPKWGDSVVKQDFAEMLMTGEIADGWGAGPVSLATGLTYRDQSFTDEAFPVDVDALGPPLNAPDLGIRGIAGTWTTGSPNLHQFSTVSLLSGQYDVWEAFGEVNLPIWQSESGDRRFGTNFAYRSSDYSSVGRIESWKYGLDYQLVRDVRFRATKSRDVREATFSERFDNSPTGGFVSEDYETMTTMVLVTATSAGNPNLRPEVADTLVYGFVYTPQWAEGLRMSVDRYEVDISDSIATLSVSDVVRECYFNNVLCENVLRDGTGTLSRVLAPYLNLDRAYVQGIDFEVDYSREVDWTAMDDESLSLRLLGGRLEHRTNTVTGSVPDELAGSLFGPSIYPELTANLTATYRFGLWSVQLQERYIDSIALDRNWVEGVDVDDNTIQSKAWTNLVLRYGREVPTGGRWSLALNVQNLFDDDPPIIPIGLGGQSTNNSYDVFGRRYQLTFNYDL
jgi:outer membrane receptor protein involved in Fe transport